MKTALIVDDSRLARTVLSRMLGEHGVAADTAPTAEAALDYLKDRRPDVVFLDHNMPGMDGFQALEAIKANPATATIPVMMYTSQEGELYLGQARALGALGVLPKSLQPVEVTKVLRSLHLIPGENAGAERGRAAPTETQRIKELIEELFYEQAAVVREEIRSELRRITSPPAPAQAPAAPASEPIPPWRDRRVAPHALRLAAGLGVAAALVSTYLFYSASELLDEANRRTSQLAAATAAAAEANAALGAADASMRDAGLVELVEWAANRDTRFAFGAVPLDDARAADFLVLLEHLGRIGFAGTVAVDVHMGRYCMSYLEDGSLGLAPADLPAASCDQIGWPELEAMAMGKQQTVAFANAVATATRGAPFRVETQSYGSAAPAVEYPLPGYDVTAGEWNAIAAANQRIGVRLIADEGYR